jgi:hypothetical protein
VYENCARDYILEFKSLRVLDTAQEYVSDSETQKLTEAQYLTVT